MAVIEIVRPDTDETQSGAHRVFTFFRDRLLSGELKVGDQFQAGEDAFAPIVTVVGIEDDSVLLDANHPLAGVDLTFDVELVSAREAKPDELAHGHAHGPGGTCHQA